MNKNKYYKINFLSADFYNEYTSELYPEIEHKENRPYVVVLIKIHENTFAVPFRTNIKHDNCYKFKTSTRPTNSITGIDFTKAVIINDSKFIGDAARINDKEYLELDSNYFIIISRFTKYVEGYIEHMKGKTNPYKAKRYQYTTLKYFHKELGV